MPPSSHSGVRSIARGRRERRHAAPDRIAGFRATPSPPRPSNGYLDISDDSVSVACSFAASLPKPQTESSPQRPGRMQTALVKLLRWISPKAGELSTDGIHLGRCRRCRGPDAMIESRRRTGSDSVLVHEGDSTSRERRPAPMSSVSIGNVIADCCTRSCHPVYCAGHFVFRSTWYGVLQSDRLSNPWFAGRGGRSNIRPKPPAGRAVGAPACVRSLDTIFIPCA